MRVKARITARLLGSTPFCRTHLMREGISPKRYLTSINVRVKIYTTRTPCCNCLERLSGHILFFFRGNRPHEVEHKQSTPFLSPSTELEYGRKDKRQHRKAQSIKARRKLRAVITQASSFMDFSGTSEVESV